MSVIGEPALPNAIDAEQALLGSILIHPMALLAAKDLTPQDFYREANAIIFATMRQLQEDGLAIDLVTLQTRLERTGQLERARGSSYLAELVTVVPTPVHARYYAELVQKAAYGRKVIEVAQNLASVGFHSTNPEAAAARVVEPLSAGQKLEKAPLADLSPEELSARLAALAPGLQRADLLLSQQFPPVLWVVPNLLAEGLTLLAAKPKLGKSWMALGLGLAVAAGGVALGQVPVERGEVLYLALEDSQKRLKARMQQLLRGEPAPAGLELETQWPRLDAGGLNLIETWLRLHPDARLVMIDTLAKIRGRARGASLYGEDYASLEEVQGLARTFGIAILVIHHTGKESREDPLDEVNATQGLNGVADNILVLRRERGKAEATLIGDGRELSGVELSLRFDVTSGAWAITEPPAETLKTPERTEILRLLEQSAEPLTPAQIAEALGKNISTVRNLLARMARVGEIKTTGYGKYAADTVSVDSVDSVDSSPARRGETTITPDIQQQDISLTAKQGHEKANPTLLPVRSVNPQESTESTESMGGPKQPPSRSWGIPPLCLPPALRPRPGVQVTEQIEATTLLELAGLLQRADLWLDEREVVRAATRMALAKDLQPQMRQELLLTWLASQHVPLIDALMGELAPRQSDRMLVLQRLAKAELRQAGVGEEPAWLKRYAHVFACVHPEGHHPAWQAHQKSARPVCPLCWPAMFSPPDAGAVA